MTRKSTVRVRARRWHHVVMVIRHGRKQIYINGRRRAEG